MKLLFLTKYTLKEHLDEDDFRALVKRFGEVGEAPGVIAHYETLDGRGGFTIAEHDDANVEGAYDAVLAYGEWLDFEITPIITMEDSLPRLLAQFG
jgi:hypothetical protein